MNKAQIKNDIEKENPGFSVYGFIELREGADIYAIEKPVKTSDRVRRARLFKVVKDTGRWAISNDDVLYSVEVSGLKSGSSLDFKAGLIFEDTPIPDDALLSLYDFIGDREALSEQVKPYDDMGGAISSAVKQARISSFGIFRANVKSPGVAYRVHIVGELGSFLIYLYFNGSGYKVSNVERVDL
ncbi:hypothetical protein [Microbulbifer thermotolerans]|uniref:hypothetical protein n=1 Tax=Microbulbifer thermotolerans TaxID=252514 RepID=UPI00224A4A08|nr:hypothetical protein [Microbulbifer thermotolerans]MCX2781258.1 hypothetical protein [Microbulbifer thermotolerans]MCX2806669.1 hypothetical protein [Microbulbifer thermotolerans]